MLNHCAVSVASERGFSDDGTDEREPDYPRVSPSQKKEWGMTLEDKQ